MKRLLEEAERLCGIVQSETKYYKQLEDEGEITIYDREEHHLYLLYYQHKLYTIWNEYDRCYEDPTYIPKI